ncbi:MAG: MBL fold metallo-hydrolase [Corynebacterium sp.]|nr:MBL fold metallo-hydrolase [Corynebacterium sp.]
MALHYETLVSGPMENNMYLLWDDAQPGADSASTGTRPVMLIDAATDAPLIKKSLDEGAFDLQAVVTTHRHWDHVEALEEILNTYKVPHYASAEEADLYPVAPTNPLSDGSHIDFAGHKLPVFIVHGHTEGGAVIEATIDGVPHLFVGDNLFPGGVGKTNSPEEFTTLWTDVVTKIFEQYPDETVVLPGHGKSTTLGAERPHLDEWKQRGW